VDAYRRTAVIVGVLFIFATAATALGDVLVGSAADAADALVQVVAHKNLVLLGAMFKIFSFAASAGIAIALYPVLRKHDERLALGSVACRVVEAVFYLVSALGLLGLLVLGQEYAGAGSQDAASLHVLVTAIASVRSMAGFVVAVIFFCLGAGMYYYVMYRSRLVPRWLSGWGLAALALLFAMVLLTAIAARPSGPSGALLALAAPLALQEMVLAVWLIVKGFNPAAIDAGRADAGPAHSLAVRSVATHEASPVATPSAA
jgi:hypothetical protein